MNYKYRKSQAQKKIALVAHDNMKGDLLDWARKNKEALAQHRLFATGTTASLLEEKLALTVKAYKSGPIGGDQQIGARIVEGKIDFLIFFWDPLEAQPHDPDIRALLRIGVLYNIPIANNRATADFLLASSLMNRPYERRMLDYKSKFKK